MKIRKPRADLVGIGLLLFLLPAGLWNIKGFAGLAPAIFEILFILLVIIACVGVPVSLVAAFLIPARSDNILWRRTVDLYRAHSSFRKRSHDPVRMTKAMGRLSDDELRVAAILPDHSDSARAMLAEEIVRRGIQPEAPAATVPSFLGYEDASGLERAVFGGAAKVRSVAFAAGVLLFVVIAVLIVWNIAAGEHQVATALSQGRITPEEAATYPGGTYEKTPPQLRDDAAMKPIVLREQIGINVAGLWAPCVLLYFLASWFRSKPVRILLLRKFNDPRLGKLYRGLAKLELLPFGHVIALSDRHVKRGFRLSLALLAAVSPAQLALQISMAPVIFLLRLTDRTRWGPAYVANARDYRLLARRLHDRMELNLQTTFSSYAYLVRSTDAWWREIIRLFMQSADVIVLDVSKVTEGTSWEIESIDRYKLWNRVVAIGSREDAAAAEIVMRDLRARGLPSPLCYYDRTGNMLARPDFRIAMFDALKASVLAKSASDEKG